MRADGYAENHEETAAGLYTASVPIHNERGTVLAAMTMCVPTSRMDPARPGPHPVTDPHRRRRGALARRRLAAVLQRQAPVTGPGGSNGAGGAGERVEPPRMGALLAAPAATGRLWLTNARLFDGTGAPARDGAAVLVEDGLIERIGERRRRRARRRARDRPRRAAR